MTPSAPYGPYASTRYHLLCELRTTRARLRIGTISEPNARKERRALQQDLVRLWATRKG